jgi:MFS family permease
MAGVAVAFAVIASGAGGSALGAVMAARILPLVLLLLLGGAAADRFGSRLVMLLADLLRCAAQAVFAALLLMGHPHLAAMLSLSALAGVGEGLFNPALSALIPRLSPRARLTQANSLVQLANSGATVAGPALAGAVAAVAGPAMVLALDPVSYVVILVIVFRLIPLEFQGRVAAYTSLGAFALGPLGLAAAGLLADTIGTTPVLAFGALWLLLAVTLASSTPAVRRPDL